jgi:hypothetical protein
VVSGCFVALGTGFEGTKIAELMLRLEVIFSGVSSFFASSLVSSDGFSPDISAGREEGTKLAASILKAAIERSFFFFLFFFFFFFLAAFCSP